MPTAPDPYRLSALIDTDSDKTTGCDVPAEDDNFAGPIEGIEYTVNAFVARFPTTAVIDAVDVDKCVSGETFEGVAVVDTVNYAAGLENGINLADIVEFRIPRDLIADPSEVTLSFHATAVDFNDVLLTTNGVAGGAPIVFQLPPVRQVPALSAGAMVLCALLLAMFAWRTSRKRRPAMQAVATLALLASTVTAVWAATIILDGDVTDWAGIAPIANDVLKDSTADDPAEDIVAAFVTADSQYLYFRMDQANLAPVVCGNGIRESGEECETDGDCGLGDFDCEDCHCEED